MQRVYRATKTAALPTPPAQAVTPGYFTAGDPGLGIPATVPGYEWFNGVQEEIAYVIETNGLVLDRLDNTLLYQAIAAQINARMATVDAFTYKGVRDCSGNPNYPAADTGDTYKVSVAGKIGGSSGPNVEVGDVLICTADGSAAGTHAAVGANWDIIQVNIDGAVIGPASATSGHLASFSGTSGKLVADAGVAVSTDGTFAANSDAKVPTEKAVKTYADGKIAGAGVVVSGNLPTFSGTTGLAVSDSGKAHSTDGTFAANSDAKVPTEKAVKTYVDAAVTGLSSTAYCGIVSFGATNLTQNSANNWLKNCPGVAASVSEAGAQYCVLYPCKLNDLTVLLSAAVPASNSLIIMIRKNGADTAMTITLSAGATTGQYTGDDVLLGEGDLLAVRGTTSATFTNTIDIGLSFTAKLLSTGVGCGIGHAFCDNTNTAPLSFGYGSIGGTEAQLEVPLKRCLVERINVPINGGGSIFVRKNAASVTGSGLATNATPKDSRAWILYDTNDLYNLRDTGSGASVIWQGAIGFANSDNSHDVYAPYFASDKTQGQATTHYLAGYGAVGSATESDVQIPMPCAGVARNLRVALDATPASGQTVTVTARKNSVDQTLTAQCTNGGGRTATDTSNSFSFVRGDVITQKSVSSATVGTRAVNTNMDLQVS